MDKFVVVGKNSKLYKSLKSTINHLVLAEYSHNDDLSLVKGENVILFSFSFDAVENTRLLELLSSVANKVIVVGSLSALSPFYNKFKYSYLKFMQYQVSKNLNNVHYKFYGVISNDLNHSNFYNFPVTSFQLFADSLFSDSYFFFCINNYSRKYCIVYKAFSNIFGALISAIVFKYLIRNNYGYNIYFES